MDGLQWTFLGPQMNFNDPYQQASEATPEDDEAEPSALLPAKTTSAKLATFAENARKRLSCSTDPRSQHYEQDKAADVVPSAATTKLGASDEKTPVEASASQSRSIWVSHPSASSNLGGIVEINRVFNITAELRAPVDFQLTHTPLLRLGCESYWTGFHFDAWHNIVVALRGRKRAMLLHPNAAKVRAHVGGWARACMTSSQRHELNITCPCSCSLLPLLGRCSRWIRMRAAQRFGSRPCK